MARIVGHLSVAELEARYRAARGRRAVERPQGRRLDGGAPRPGEGAPAARLGGPEAHRLVDPGATAAAPAGGDTRAAGGVQGGLEAAVAEARAAHPDRPVEVWAEDGWTHCVQPARPEAGPAPGLGPRRPAAGRARAPPLPVAARDRFRAADQRRGDLVPLDRPVEALLRG